MLVVGRQKTMGDAPAASTTELINNGVAACIMRQFARPPTPPPAPMPVWPVVAGIGLLFAWALVAQAHATAHAH